MSDIYGKVAIEQLSAYKAETATQLATKADVITTEGLQSQVNSIVLEGTSGDSSAEVSQARVDVQGGTFQTIKSHLDNIENIVLNETNRIFFSDWESGSIDGVTGINSVNGTRIRTADYHQFENNINVVLADGYTMMIVVYNGSQTKLTTINFFIGSYTLVVNSTYLYRFVLKKIDDTQVDVTISVNAVLTTVFNSNIRTDLTTAQTNITALDTEINAVKNKLNNNNEELVLAWESGGFSTGATGDYTTDTNRIRAGFVDLESYDTITITVNSGFQVLCARYEAADDFTTYGGQYGYITSLTSPYVINIARDQSQFMFMMKNDANSGLTASAGANCTVVGHLKDVSNAVRDYVSSEISTAVSDKVISNTIPTLKLTTQADYNSATNDVLNDDTMHVMSGKCNEMKSCFNGKIMQYSDPSRTNLCKFGLLSDVHVGSTVWNDDYTNLVNVLDFLSNQNVDFNVITGDVINSDAVNTPSLVAAQLETYRLYFKETNVSVYPLRGNHDNSVQAFSYTGSIDFGNIKLVYFGVIYKEMDIPEGQTETTWNTGMVTDETLTWLDTVLSESTAKHNIVMCHFSIATDNTYTNFKWWIQDSFVGKDGFTYDGKRTALLNILDTHNVKLYINGHEHNYSYPTALVDGTGITDLNGGSTIDRFSICTITDIQATFDIYNTSDLSFVKTVTIPLV